VAVGYSLLNPARPVDSRWQLARLLAGGTVLPADWCDAWVTRATTYLRALKSCTADADLGRLAVDSPEIHAAVMLREGGDKIARGHAEGLLLAGQTPEQVAAATGLTPGTIEAYHALFFSVSGRLHARTFIMTSAVAGPGSYTTGVEDVDGVLRRAGFFFGPLFLEILASQLRTELRVPASLACMKRAQLQELHGLLMARALVHAFGLPHGEWGRTLVLRRLLHELQGLIDEWPEEGAAQPAGQFAGLATSALERWWAGWRELAAAASSGADFVRVA
jgi:hypothetical protein